MVYAMVAQLCTEIACMSNVLRSACLLYLPRLSPGSVYLQSSDRPPTAQSVTTLTVRVAGCSYDDTDINIQQIRSVCLCLYLSLSLCLCLTLSPCPIPLVSAPPPPNLDRIHRCCTTKIIDRAKICETGGGVGWGWGGGGEGGRRKERTVHVSLFPLLFRSFFLFSFFLSSSSLFLSFQQFFRPGESPSARKARRP